MYGDPRRIYVGDWIRSETENGLPSSVSVDHHSFFQRFARFRRLGVLLTMAISSRQRRRRLWSLPFLLCSISSDCVMASFLFGTGTPGQRRCGSSCVWKSRLQDSPSTTRTVALPKPIGLILQETEDEGGVFLLEMDPQGAAAKESFSGRADVCCGDALIAINGMDCERSSFEDVMDLMASAASPVDLTLRRPAGHVSVKFENGVAIAAPPGTPLRELAYIAQVDIPYSCTSGGCGTCEQSLVCDSAEPRYVRPCVGRVPKGYDAIAILPSDRCEPQ